MGIPLRVVIFGGGGPNLRYPDAPPGAVYGLRWSVVGGHALCDRRGSRPAGFCNGRDSRGVSGASAFDPSTCCGLHGFGYGSAHRSLVVVLLADLIVGDFKETVRPLAGA